MQVSQTQLIPWFFTFILNILSTKNYFTAFYDKNQKTKSFEVSTVPTKQQRKIWNLLTFLDWVKHQGVNIFCTTSIFGALSPYVVTFNLLNNLLEYLRMTELSNVHITLQLNTAREKKEYYTRNIEDAKST